MPFVTNRTPSFKIEFIKENIIYGIISALNFFLINSLKFSFLSACKNAMQPETTKNIGTWNSNK